MEILSSQIKHIVHCCAFFALFAFTYVFITQPSTNIDPWKEYGYIPSTVLYILSVLPLLGFPQLLFVITGLLYFNQFREKLTLNGDLLQAPFLCFRVVTRGDYPELVKKNVKRNLKKCQSLGLENFCFEVVTDSATGIIQENKIREIVVPKDYNTSSGALYKARALQYALEDKVNILKNENWVVHLDEETVLTESSIIGIVNFVINGKYQLGQGAITYADEEIVNWLTTLIDTSRVSDDFGNLQFQLAILHRPIFTIKGSFLVIQYVVEKDVTFDHGIEGSIVEDNFFANIAVTKGYKFNFIQGVMWEKSPFTFSDCIKQRTRWNQGVFLILSSSKIPLKNKFFIFFSFCAVLASPLSMVYYILSLFYPIPLCTILNLLNAFILSVCSYNNVFGVIKSFSIERFGIFKVILIATISYLLLPVLGVLQSCVSYQSLFGKKNKFYIVDKNIKETVTLQTV
ncbi:beta-1,4-mannosyltransferase egh-like [Diabrotica undecimpunctata]|uniref:beta-1,4-mannosyltransferase egh-like n=1 Tax=Diabrotica undecimpunctata TaxID=50387 RepID=UPI003B63DCF9